MPLMPTLSEVGWTNNLGEKLDFALAHFFEAEETQTYLYPGKIADIHSIIMRNAHDIDSMVSEMRSILQDYLNTLFDHAQVEGLYISKQKKDPTNRVTIQMTIAVSDEGEQTISQSLANYEFNRFHSITRVSNYGDRT